ncbi:MAG: GNAT family N-acetyltransferase [Candidatus Bathyarchaeota archaeon]|nr:GNAT family N-acetyltransferase [Candidatus Bathyarchaeota archaeon]
MVNAERLESFWLDLISAFPSKKLDGATVVCIPKVPLYVINHAANVDAKKELCGPLIKGVEEHFRSEGVSFVCFRVSPLTRPSDFTSLLADAGFESKGEQSVMVYQGIRVQEQTVNPTSAVKQVVSEAEVAVLNRLLFEVFEMPPEWGKAFDEFTHECMRVGWRFYLGYVGDEPVGTCALFSAGNVGGIFDVGTLPRYRGQGVGTALTLYALNDSVLAGNSVHTLQAECKGNAERLYQKIGFAVDHKICFYAKDL